MADFPLDPHLRALLSRVNSEALAMAQHNANPRHPSRDALHDAVAALVDWHRKESER